MGYLGVQQDALDARISDRCGPLVVCECTGGCGLPAGGSGGGGKNPRSITTLLHSYFTGGGGNNLVRASTDGLNFPTEVMVSLPSADLSVPKWTHAGLSDGITCRFCAGVSRVGPGVPNALTASVDKIPLATDTASADSSISTARAASMGVGNQTVGFIIGGFDSSSLSLPAESFSYSTGTFSVLGVPLQTGAVVGDQDYVYEAGEVSNDTQGWLLGGLDWNGESGSPFRRTTVDLVTFSTASVALASSTTSVLRSDIAAAGNATVGVFIGGDVSIFPTSELTLTDVMEKVIYATDTLASAGSASFKIMDASMTGTDTYGYLSGGYLGDVSAAWLSGTDRLEYATDTLSGVDSASLKSGSRSSMEAAGTSYF